MRFNFLCAIFAVILAVTSVAHAADFFYNDVTGASQWEEPEHPVSYTDDEGRKYWHNSQTGESSWEYPGGVWEEVHSEEHGQAYFFNKETKDSIWERPEVMGWRRVTKEDL